VLYTPDFREHVHTGNRMGDSWEFRLGAASVELFNRLLGGVFEAVVPVNARPPLPSVPPRLVGVIEPRIEEFDFGLPFLKTGTYTASIGYRITAYSMAGVPVASWRVRGEGAKTGAIGMEFARWPGEAADLAMHDAAVKVAESFGRVPEVARWLREQGVAVAATHPLAPVSSPASPPLAVAAPARTAALVGRWSGNIWAPPSQFSTTAYRQFPVTLVVGPDQRWTISGGHETRFDAAGSVQVVDDAILLVGTQGPARVSITYTVTTVRRRTLEASGVGADQIVYRLALERIQ
jgi:hypothetical protein